MRIHTYRYTYIIKYQNIYIYIYIFKCIYILEVYRMWDFQYSRMRIRMRILHFNIRGYRMRMRILYILLY